MTEQEHVPAPISTTVGPFQIRADPLAMASPASVNVSNETGERGIICACEEPILTGDVVLDYEDPDDGQTYRAHAICWEIAEQDGDWFWDSGPRPGAHSSIPVEQLGPEDRKLVERACWAASVIAKALRAGNEGHVKAFIDWKDEGLDAALDLYREVHKDEVAAIRAARKVGETLPDEAAAAVKDVVEGRRHDVLKAGPDVVCHLCGEAFANGEPGVVHRTVDAARQVLSHFPCALKGENGTGAWGEDEDGDPEESYVWPGFVGIVSYSDSETALPAKEFEFRRKTNEKARAKLRAALAARFLEGQRKRATDLAAQFSREVKILRRRKGDR